MPRRPLTLLAALCTAALVAGCGGSSSPKPAARDQSPSPSPGAPSPTASATPTVAAGVQGDPLTGAPNVSTGPVVGVKIDNERLAYPYQRGIDHAAVVYQELIEGGATRLFGIFEGAQTEEIGPVRSIRSSDAELAAEYGPLPVAFSGGNKGVLKTIAKSSIINASYDVAPSAYRIGEHRPDANNFYVRIAALIKQVHGGAAPRDVGLRFGPPPTGVGTPASSLSVEFSKGVTATFRYDVSTHSYPAQQIAHPMTLVGGGRVAPQNVIVQMVSVAPDKYVDILGHRTPYTHSVGTGTAAVFRDGVRIDGTWSRPTKAAGTHFLDKVGHDIGLRPGQTWILLLPQGQPLTVK